MDNAYIKGIIDERETAQEKIRKLKAELRVLEDVLEFQTKIVNRLLEREVTS